MRLVPKEVKKIFVLRVDQMCQVTPAKHRCNQISEHLKEGRWSQRAETLCILIGTFLFVSE